jgi:hypothetical protein
MVMSTATHCYVCGEEVGDVALIILTKHGFVQCCKGACRYALNAIDTPDMYEQHQRGEMRERAK